MIQKNKTGTSKLGAIRLKKRKNFKIVKGETLWAFLKLHFVLKGPFGDRTFSEKVSQRRKKLKGGTLRDTSR